MVDEVRLLGILLSSDLKWHKHVNFCIKKASKLCFLIIQLRRSGLSKNLLWKVYNSVIRSVLTFAFPCYCNLTAAQFKLMENLERRISKIIGSSPSITLKEFCDKLCSGHAKKIIFNSSHSFRELLIERSGSGARRIRQSTRCVSLAPPLAHTTRFKESFIRYFKWHCTYCNIRLIPHSTLHVNFILHVWLFVSASVIRLYYVLCCQNICFFIY